MSIAIGNKIIAGNAAVINSDTLCNPNLVRNPNFKIRTNNKTSYTSNSGICVDGWMIGVNGSTTKHTIVPCDEGLSVSVTSSDQNGWIHLEQSIDRNYISRGDDYSVSISVDGEVYSASYVANNTTSHLYVDGKVRTFYFENDNQHRIGIRIYGGETIVINWIKLEKGPNTTMYVDPVPYMEFLKCQGSVLNDGTSALTSSFSNPNIIHNPDFTINQRGKASYSGDSIYSYDRWRISGCTINADGLGGATLTKNTGKDYYSLTQYIPTTDNNIKSKHVTLSLNIGTTTYVSTGIPTDGFTLIVEDNNRCVVTYDSDKDCVVVTFFGHKTYKINWIKLELGVIATAFNHPDIGTELVKCQRFYQKLSTNPLMGVAMTTNSIRFQTSTVCTLIGIPSISLSLHALEGSTVYTQYLIKTPTGTAVATVDASTITNTTFNTSEGCLNFTVVFNSLNLTKYANYNMFPVDGAYIEIEASCDI